MIEPLLTSHKGEGSTGDRSRFRDRGYVIDIIRLLSLRIARNKTPTALCSGFVLIIGVVMPLTLGVKF